MESRNPVQHPSAPGEGQALGLWTVSAQWRWSSPNPYSLWEETHELCTVTLPSMLNTQELQVLLSCLMFLTTHLLSLLNKLSSHHVSVSPMTVPSPQCHDQLVTRTRFPYLLLHRIQPVFMQWLLTQVLSPSLILYDLGRSDTQDD